MAPKTLTREQIAAVLAELGDRDRLLFYTLARTGVRIGELLGAQWRDLEATPDGPVLVVGRQHYRGELREGAKTEAGDRRVSIVPSLARALTRHRTAKEKAAICGGFARADGRTRTGDPFITSEVLYQLSYVGGDSAG
jgi:integrase